MYNGIFPYVASILRKLKSSILSCKTYFTIGKRVYYFGYWKMYSEIQKLSKLYYRIIEELLKISF